MEKKSELKTLSEMMDVLRRDIDQLKQNRMGLQTATRRLEDVMFSTTQSRNDVTEETK